MADRARKFSFRYLVDKKFNSIDDKEKQEWLLKWSMKDRIKAQMFTFDQPFQPYEKDNFGLDFMTDPEVVSSLQMLSSQDRWTPVGIVAKSVTVEPVACFALSMAFFDRLYENQIVRESGHIHKCLDEFYEDFTISDELRKLLIQEDCDNFCLFNESERNEFLFLLFKHFCLGGKVCQYEDSIDPYLDFTKQVYKELISVQKNPETKELGILSNVFKLTASGDSGVYYPSSVAHEQTFSYLIVDALKRHITMLYHRFGSSGFS
ncbi:cilia- and flagella-associated protein 300-like [Gigantopelta aegis]|uniref:cilia- and flagella-associated protein 300-like n=1 Tax=Gigantopelta aegis TaxID=1735272 RepID=UPI001B8878E7|nr:cilia- and flagella-associated protein 300-like [Gigantopelta aegis]